MDKCAHTPISIILKKLAADLIVVNEIAMKACFSHNELLYNFVDEGFNWRINPFLSLKNWT